MDPASLLRATPELVSTQEESEEIKMDTDLENLRLQSLLQELYVALVDKTRTGIDQARFSIKVHYKWLVDHISRGRGVDVNANDIIDMHVKICKMARRLAKKAFDENNDFVDGSETRRLEKEIAFL